jgi:predicted nuclease with TOPRIM domain
MAGTQRNSETEDYEKLKKELDEAKAEMEEFQEALAETAREDDRKDEKHKNAPEKANQNIMTLKKENAKLMTKLEQVYHGEDSN